MGITIDRRVSLIRIMHGVGGCLFSFVWGDCVTHRLMTESVLLYADNMAVWYHL